MDGFLNHRVIVLHSHRGAVEARLAQRFDVIALQPPRINFDSRFDVRRELETGLDEPAQGANFFRQQKRGRAAAEMQLHRLPFRIQKWRHQIHLFLQVFQICGALSLLRCDHGGASAEPAERLAKGEVKVKREVARALVVGANRFQHAFLRQLFAELRCRRIRGVARARDVVFLDQVEVDFEHAHLKLRTVVTKLSMHSSLALGGTPCPRLKICPGLPFTLSKMCRARVSS